MVNGRKFLVLKEWDWKGLRGKDGYIVGYRKSLGTFRVVKRVWVEGRVIPKCELFVKLMHILGIIETIFLNSLKETHTSLSYYKNCRSFILQFLIQFLQ